jgi:transcriptional regulator with XRE-family HTH domain
LDLIGKLKQKQDDLGLSDRAFAKTLNIERSMWRWIKAGKRNLGPKTLAAIRERFPELTPDTMFYFEERVALANKRQERDSDNGGD